jgi:hypothetical protein
VNRTARQSLRSGFLPWAAVLFLAAQGCEPSDTPGGRLEQILLALQSKNPTPEGIWLLHLDETAVVLATGRYDNGAEREIALGLFFSQASVEPAELGCQEDDLTGARVVLSGRAAGTTSLTASTREEPAAIIPCATRPDGGWTFPDGGIEWPLRSQPMTVTVLSD